MTASAGSMGGIVLASRALSCCFAALAGMVLFAVPVGSAFGLTIETDLKTELGIRPARSSASSPDRPRAPPPIPIIRATGPIEPGDHYRLRSTLARLKAAGGERQPDQPFAIVELHSPGGDAMEAFSLGYLFREFDVATVVRKGDICMSACALAFLGGTVSHLPPTVVPGRNIEIGGIVGFHNFYINPAYTKTVTGPASEAVSSGYMMAQLSASGFARYVTFMGVDPAFIARILERPPTTWEYIDTAAQFIDLNVCPMGAPPPKTAPDVLAANICGNAFGMTTSADSKDVRPITAADLKRRLLEYVQRNARTFRMGRRASDELARTLEGSDNKKIDEIYGDLQDSGVPLPNLMTKSFQVVGSASDYDVRCNISLSDEQPPAFDLVIEGPGGLSRSLQATPLACPILFSFKRDDAINPAPDRTPQWLPPSSQGTRRN